MVGVILLRKEIIEIESIRKPEGPFNHVVKAGNFLFLTSQLSVDLKTNRIIRGTVGEQTGRAMDNIRLLLEASGATMEDVVKVVIYMRDVSRFSEMNAVYKEYFKVGEEPARVTIQAPSPIEGVNIEIEVTAIIPK